MNDVNFNNAWLMLKQLSKPTLDQLRAHQYYPQPQNPQDYQQYYPRPQNPQDYQRGYPNTQIGQGDGGESPWGNPPNDPYNPMQPGGGGPQDKRCSKCRYAPLTTPEEMWSGVCRKCSSLGDKPPWQPPQPDDHYPPWQPDKNPSDKSPYDPERNPDEDGKRKDWEQGWERCRRCFGTGMIDSHPGPWYDGQGVNKSEGFLERFIKGERIFKLNIPGSPWQPDKNPSDESPYDYPERPRGPPRGFQVRCPDCNGRGKVRSGPTRYPGGGATNA